MWLWERHLTPCSPVLWVCICWKNLCWTRLRGSIRMVQERNIMVEQLQWCVFELVQWIVKSTDLIHQKLTGLLKCVEHSTAVIISYDSLLTLNPSCKPPSIFFSLFLFSLSLYFFKSSIYFNLIFFIFIYLLACLLWLQSNFMSLIFLLSHTHSE